MRRSRRSAGSQLVGVLAAATGATALTLSNFQVVTSVNTPLACLIAYNSPIQGCQSSDFTAGRDCSDACVRGLFKTTSNVVGACDGVNAPRDSLIAKALRGELVATLCPSRFQKGPPSQSTSPPPKTTAKPPARTTDVEVSVTTTVSDDAPPAESTDDADPTTTTTEVVVIPSPTQSAVSTVTQPTNAQQSGAGDGGTGSGIIGSGGGSPFDLGGPVGSGSWRAKAGPWEVAMVAAGVVALVLR